jgi:heptaprenyl diphosphate synthase
VSVTGGVLHNIGQIAMACILLGTNAIAYYLPFLILSGTIAGILIGLVAAMLVKRIPVD